MSARTVTPVLALAFAALLVLVHSACSTGATSGGPQEGATPGDPTHGSPARAKAAPMMPMEAYAAAEPWQSRSTPGHTVAPPDPAGETWRVLVNQHAPMQKRTPRWQDLPADRSVRVQMLPDSGLACVVTPLAVRPESDDFGTKLKAWLMERELRCSSDGFASWSAYHHRVRLRPDGTRERLEARAHLRQRGRDGQVRRTLIKVRDDREQRAATTGPPALRHDLSVDDD